MKYLRIIALTLCTLLFWTVAHATQRNLKVTASTAQAQKRVALVIGNAAYQGAPALRNPVNDARAMSNALNGLGFQVIEVTDASQKEMNRAITTFGSKLDAETVALFFYAGHGLQVKGKNYIVPVDAQIEMESAIASEAVGVDAVLEQLNSSPISIVVLDACRNNPFERSFRKMGGGGLAQMDAPKGSFIAYATAPGKTAADGDGKNGLFTQELLKQINEPGLSLESVFKRVRSSVSAKSGDAQMPWDSSSMTGEFYFKPGSGTQVASLVPVPTPTHSSRTRKTKEEIEQGSWESAKNSNAIEAIQEYLKQYPKGAYAGQARILIASLNAQSSKPVEPAAPAGREDNETALWNEAQKGNSREDYQAYLGQYPKGKYVALAKARLKKIDDEAAQQAKQERAATAQQAAQQEQGAWDSANSNASEASYQDYLDAYPQGHFATLAQARIAKLKKEADTAAAQQQRQQAEAAYVSQGGLTWMPIMFRKNWGDADSYCANITSRGQGGWRLPTKAELVALYNSGVLNGQGWALNYTWTSTPAKLAHYFVDLSDGNVNWNYDNSGNYVTCVR